MATPITKLPAGKITAPKLGKSLKTLAPPPLKKQAVTAKNTNGWGKPRNAVDRAAEGKSAQTTINTDRGTFQVQ